MNIKIDASGQEVLGFVDRVCKGLEWLGSKQMYIWRIEYSMERLDKARNELRDTMEMAVGTMEGALHNGWWPLKAPAKGWLRDGLVISDRANKILLWYKEQINDDGDHAATTSIFLCPCEALSWRTRNAQAIMRMNQILQHKSQGAVYEKGAFEDVAFKRGADDDQETRDPKAIHSLLKALACLSLDDRTAALLAPPPSVSPSPPSTLPTTHVATPSDGPDSSICSPVPPLSEVSGQQEEQQVAASSAEKVELKAFTKYRAFELSQSYEGVPVVIRVKAPRYTPRSRTPVDLVMVLDVSGSMAGKRLDQMKTGSMFVAHNLEATDRLSVVVFGTDARRLLPLIAMSDEAKILTNRLIGSLFAGGITRVEPALELAYKSLDARSDEADRVSSIIVLTDGQWQNPVESIPFQEKYPTYVLCMGRDHDPLPPYYFATKGHGTFSFVIDELEVIKDAMALYIGGQTSIVAQDVKISIYSAHRDVRISDIACGGYAHSIGDRGKSGSITVNDLCGNEEKNFIVYVNVPWEQADNFARAPKTKLLTVSASYYSPLIEGHVHADTIEVFVDRPAKISSRGQDISAEVASEVIRANVFKGVGEILHAIWEMKGRSNPESYGYITKKLYDLRDSINSTEESKAAKDRWDDLSTDLDEMTLPTPALFFSLSLPYMLSWLSSHQWQRAATPGSISKSRWFSFMTTRMRNMIDSVESAPAAFF